MKKELLLTVGLPRSGKTTWAMEQGVPVVNPDSIRLALHGQRFLQSAESIVWAHAYLMARALLISGHDRVIVDATNVTRGRRNQWIMQVGDLAEVRFVVFDTSPDECKRRALATNDEYILPVIDGMAEQFELSDITCEQPEWVTLHDNQ